MMMPFSCLTRPTLVKDALEASRPFERAVQTLPDLHDVKEVKVCEDHGERVRKNEDHQAKRHPEVCVELLPLPATIQSSRVESSQFHK